MTDLLIWQTNVLETTFYKLDYVTAMAFSPDGAYLVLAHENRYGGDDFTLVLVDVAARTVLAQTVLDFASQQIAFMPQQNALIMYGITPKRTGIFETNSGSQAALVELPNLSVSWQVALPDVFDGIYKLDPDAGETPENLVFWYPAVTLAPAAQKLYIVHADGDRLTTVDFAARDTQTTPIAPQIGLLERLMALTANNTAHAKVANGTSKQAVLSPDSTRLYVVGETNNSRQGADDNWTFEQTASGLQVIDTATGIELVHIDTQATRISMSHDSAQLLLYTQYDALATDILAADTLNTLAHIPNRYVWSVQRLDGKSLLISSLTTYGPDGRTDLAVLDAQTFDPLQTWTMEGSITLLAAQ